jgi:hypothetical protein
MSGNSMKVTAVKDGGMDKWEEDHMLHTILEAEKIRADPKKMAGVKRAAKRKITEANALKALAK